MTRKLLGGILRIGCVLFIGLIKQQADSLRIESEPAHAPDEIDSGLASISSTATVFLLTGVKMRGVPVGVREIENAQTDPISRNCGR